MALWFCKGGMGLKVCKVISDLTCIDSIKTYSLKSLGLQYNFLNLILPDDHTHSKERGSLGFIRRTEEAVFSKGRDCCLGSARG